MIYQRHPHLFARCWPIFWPWLWWQLVELEAWVEHEQRDLIIGVSWYGRIMILALGDPPRPTDYVRPLSCALAAFDSDGAIPAGVDLGCSSLRVALSRVVKLRCRAWRMPGATIAPLRALIPFPGCPPSLPVA